MPAAKAIARSPRRTASARSASSTATKAAAAHIDPQLLRRGAAQAVAALKLLANEDRLMLLCQLSQGELCVSELEQELDIHQPTLSQQLGVLRNEGVVETRRVGKNIYYRVCDAALLDILAVLYKLYCPK